MVMIIEDYVSFETSKLLKEKGMDTACFKHYVQKNNDDGTSEAVTVCTLQMAMKWLMEVHNLFISIEIGVGAYVWTITNTTDYVVVYVDATVGTYKEACEAAIKYCLENLI